MSKVLIGVGIGCGAIVLIGAVALVAGGMWVKGKAEEFAGAAGGGEKMQPLETRVDELNKRYAFSEPPKGQPLALDEDQLQAYLKVRSALKPVMDDFEVKAKEFETQNQGDQASIGKSLQAIGKASSMMSDLRLNLSTRWLDELEQQKMSPREFHAITAAVYTSQWNKEKGEAPKHQRTMYEQLKSGYQKQASDSSLTEDKREWARQQMAEMDKKLAALPAANTPPPESQKVFEANAELSKKYMKKIEEASSVGLDVLLVGNGNELGTALQDALGGEANGENELTGENPTPSE